MVAVPLPEKTEETIWKFADELIGARSIASIGIDSRGPAHSERTRQSAAGD
jgi:hypothetical protein